ncbi:MAG: protein kinase [Planctomycetaceae bacterium]|nr:protein kinase [Planctomycetaceae bacterium]
MSDDSPQLSHVPPENAPSVDPQSVEGIFVNALALTSKEERTRFLDEVCGENIEQRQKVDLLLRAYEDAGSFLEQPVSDIPAQFEKPSLSLDFLTPSDDPSLLGTLGPYEVYEILGHGGMGIVFRGRDPKLNRVVAIKVMSPALAINPNARRRFIREAQAAAAISHPHVVTIHAVDDDGQIPYLVMECVVGQSLQQKIDKVGSLRLTEILRISRQIAEGLAAAHKQGLIHRDIKPANILLENGVERVKITDFGLARAVDDVSMTRTGEIAGTPQFMSPEQARGERVDQRSDLFSLGCVMYAMCTGRSPFRATSYAASVHHVVNSPPRPIEEINPEIPDWLAAVVARLLSKNPDERPQTADEVAQHMEHFLSAVQSPTTTSQPIPIPPPSTSLPVSAKKGDASDTEWPRPALADELGDAFKRCGLYAALLTLVMFVFWALGPRVFDTSHQPFAGGYGLFVLILAGIIGWAGSRTREAPWGTEAFLYMLDAAVMTILLPVAAVFGAPLAVLTFWTLYTKRGRTAAISASDTGTVHAQLPHRLIDVGVFLGAAVLTACIALLVQPRLQYVPQSLLAIGPISLVIVILTLPLRGRLFQHRFWRDLGISIGAIIATAAVLVSQRWFDPIAFPGSLMPEWLTRILTVVMFGGPLLFGGWFVLHVSGVFDGIRGNVKTSPLETVFRSIAALGVLFVLTFAVMVGVYLVSQTPGNGPTGILRIHVAEGEVIGQVSVDGRPATSRMKIGNIYEFDRVPLGRRHITANLGNGRIFSESIEIFPRINNVDVPGMTPAIPIARVDSMSDPMYGDIPSGATEPMRSDSGMRSSGYPGMSLDMSSSGYPGMGPSGSPGMEFPGFGNPDPNDQLLRYKTELQLQQSQRLQLSNQLGTDHPKIKEIDARIATLEKLIEEFIPNATVEQDEESLNRLLREQVQERLLSSKQQLADLISKYGIDHPEVRQTEALIANLEQAKADMAIKEDVKETPEPRVVSSPFIVSLPGGGRYGFLGIVIDDPGIRVAVRRKSEFDGTLSAEEEVFTHIGTNSISVKPGTYQILVQRNWIGWGRQQLEATVTEKKATKVRVSNDFSAQASIPADELNLHEGFKFFWNSIPYQFGEASKSWSQVEHATLCQLLNAYAAGKPVSKLEYDGMYANLPRELVNIDPDSRAVQLVPLEAVELTIDTQSEYVSSQLTFPEEMGGVREFTELGRTTIFVPPGVYGWDVFDAHIRWMGVRPSTLVTLTQNERKTLVATRDLSNYITPQRAEGFLRTVPGRDYVFHWGGESFRAQYSVRDSMSTSDTTLFFDKEQATIIGRLIQGLADKRYELPESELIAGITRDGKPVERISDVFQSIGQPQQHQGSTTFTPDSWLILPGSKEGMYRIRPWPKGLVSDEEHEQLFGPEVEVVEPEVKKPETEQPAKAAAPVESAS